MDILKITKSKARKKILDLFFSDTKKKYYLREMERILDIPVGNIRRELLSLGKSGLFKREKMGKQVYYSLNEESPIFEEFKKIVSKTIGIESQIKKILTLVNNIAIAFIFGSYASGKEDSFSDIDLMLIGNPDDNLLIKKISRLETQIGREINYHIFSLKDWIEKVREKDSFIQNIILKPKIFLIGSKNELSRIH